MGIIQRIDTLIDIEIIMCVINWKVKMGTRKISTMKQSDYSET